MVECFSTSSRTEIAIDYYDKHIFKGKTFADLQNSGGPFILINASDLNSQSQFIFLQTQFDFLCSDLSQFKVARAVAASSAVPILFPPILLERHDNCHYEKPVWLSHAEKKAEQESNDRLKQSVSALNYYLDKDNPPFVTLLDGGITDNLGLRTILKTVSLSGGVQKIYDTEFKFQTPPKRLVVIVVDASTSTETRRPDAQCYFSSRNSRRISSKITPGPEPEADSGTIPRSACAVAFSSGFISLIGTPVASASAVVVSSFASLTPIST